MMLLVPDFSWRELALLALFLLLLYRYTSLTLAIALMALGLLALALLPADLVPSLLSLGTIGVGLGVLAHHCQQRQATLRRQARRPRSYTRPHDEFRT
jgi:hypothetical protein